MANIAPQAVKEISQKVLAQPETTDEPKNGPTVNPIPVTPRATTRAQFRKNNSPIVLAMPATAIGAKMAIESTGFAKTGEIDESLSHAADRPGEISDGNKKSIKAAISPVTTEKRTRRRNWVDVMDANAILSGVQLFFRVRLKG